jgi:AmmeMemoRadiSam system protein A
MKLSRGDQQELIRMAKEAIASTRGHKNQPSQAISTSEKFRLCCGAFVSIYVEGDLRGCIGTFSEESPLYKIIREMAISAATSDTRFKPLSPSELDKLEIEISVLSPRIPISDKSEIIIGKHGIFMEKGLNRGTLLPQVAKNQKWTVEELLGNCARYKAGIGWDGWKSADLYTYEASVFSSEDLS